MSEDSARTPERHVDALAALLTAAGCSATRESAALPDALGRVLADDVAAPHDSPRFDNSQMDGYAVSRAGLSRASRDFRVGPTLPAGTAATALYPEGLAENIACPLMTGSELPAGAAAVVPVEDCDPPRFLDPGETVRVPTAKEGTFLRPAGSDLARGDVVLHADTVVTPQAVAVAASQGLRELPVRRRPRVLVCTGGEEIADPGAAETTVPGDAASDGESPSHESAPVIPDANRPLLEAMAREHGVEVVAALHTGDDPEALAETLRAGIDRHRPDLILTSGGISHGKFEVVRNVLSADPGAWFGHVAQQPGGPQGHGTVHGVPVVCLPGNPVSTLVSFRMLVVPALARVFGATPAPPVLEARLLEPVRGIPGKTRFLRAALGTSGPILTVSPVGGPGSHLLAQAVPANALLTVPAGSALDAGATVTVHPLGRSAPYAPTDRYHPTQEES